MDAPEPTFSFKPKIMFLALMAMGKVFYLPDTSDFFDKDRDLWESAQAVQMESTFPKA